jgi:DNA-binding CsgD family transcriptional regulator
VSPAQLTAREVEIRDLAAEGKTNEEIAGHLGLSRRTVEAHLRMVYRKTGLSRRGDLNTDSAPADTLPVRRRVEELERHLELCARRLQRYENAMRRITDRQFPLFHEKLDITIKIGANPLEDRVTERHWTDPNPYLVYRVVRPITADGVATTDDMVESLAVTCEVDRADVGVAVEVVPDLDSRPRALVMFQPGLDRPAGWILRYRTPGLWDPLRTEGVDHLTYVTGTLDKRHTKGIDELRIHFEFPANAENADVQEQGGGGQTECHSATEIVYADLSGTGGPHNFELRMKPTV